ncbi:[F-actin]-monooxygenase mical1 [Balamuthia mandrillaris]
MEEVERIIAVFKQIDVDGSGVVDRSEFEQAVTQLEKDKGTPEHLIPEIVEKKFRKADRDGSGTVDMSEFLRSYYDIFDAERKETAKIVAESSGLSETEAEQLLQRFEEYDLDGDGVIDQDEFYQLKAELAPHVSKLLVRQDSNKLFRKADKDKTGALSKAEFLEAVSGLLGQSSSLGDSSGGSSSSGMSADSVWNEFTEADNVVAILQRFDELKEICGVPAGATAAQLYDAIKAKTQANYRSKVLWKLLDVKKAEAVYKPKPGDKELRVLIVGAGPAGLRTAVEALLLGARVTILEKRLKFTRHNLLHIWDSSIRDLKNIGAKYFFPQFCTGGINHIAIRRLQTLLLKVCLLLGARYYPRVDYQRTVEDSGSDLWKAEVTSKGAAPKDEDLLFNVIVGADGQNSKIAADFHFERKITKGGLAIGITANFENKQTKEENNLREFGLLAVYNQGFFKALNEKYSIDLENLVYYRGETHYFVMTVKKQSLLAKGVLKQDSQDTQGLVAPNNVAKENLEQLCREVALHVGLPTSVSFSKNSRHNNDVAIFDFSNKQVCTEQAKLFGAGMVELGVSGGPSSSSAAAGGPRQPLLVCLAGDSAIEPFWPLGTGANRAILAAQDAAWMMKRMKEGGEKEDPHKLREEWGSYYKILMTAEQKDLEKNFGKHTMDPSTRYTKNTLSHFH